MCFVLKTIPWEHFIYCIQISDYLVTVFQVWLLLSLLYKEERVYARFKTLKHAYCGYRRFLHVYKIFKNIGTSKSENKFNDANVNKLYWFGFMVFNATFNNISVISWQSVLLMEGTGVHWENHRPVASHWQTLSHKEERVYARFKTLKHAYCGYRRFLHVYKIFKNIWSIYIHHC
jgi:hypothetical protein